MKPQYRTRAADHATWQRVLLMAGAVLMLAAIAWSLRPASVAAAEITVYRSPSCGCCGNWVEHLRKHGHKVTVRNSDNMSRIKMIAGVPDALQSCHTAIAGDYVIEGHVPARDIERLLAERPRQAGLAVPGMPAGSPGMEGGAPEPYQVILFSSDGKQKVYARY